MNNPNPFIPQGTLLDQRNKKRARFKYAMFAIFACNILLVGPLLLNGGCRRGDSANNDNSSQDNSQQASTPDTSTNTTPTVAMTSSVPASNPVVAVAPVTPPPAPPPAPPAAESEYVIKAGDKLGDIAKNNHVSLKALEDANPGVVPTKL